MPATCGPEKPSPASTLNPSGPACSSNAPPAAPPGVPNPSCASTNSLGGYGAEGDASAPEAARVVKGVAAAARPRSRDKKRGTMLPDTSHGVPAANRRDSADGLSLI